MKLYSLNSINIHMDPVLSELIPRESCNFCNKAIRNLCRYSDSSELDRDQNLNELTDLVLLCRESYTTYVDVGYGGMSVNEINEFLKTNDTGVK